jgi:hypothetical protein
MPGLGKIVFLIIAATVPIAAGCNQGSLSGTAPVRGKVTYNGQPVAGATVSFIGEGAARPAVAVTDASGGYQLMTLDTKGAMPGKYTALVTKAENAASAEAPVSMDDAARNLGKASVPKALLPAKYGDASKSPFKFEVKAGQSNAFDLPLAD